MIRREQYISHPYQVPICLESTEAFVTNSHEPLSYGGLRCYWKDKITVGRFLQISLPELNPEFFAKSQVIWRRTIADGYELGLVFLDRNQAYKMRMLEQVCYISCYRQWIYQQEGRNMDKEEAALEWINKFAGRFPRIIS